MLRRKTQEERAWLVENAPLHSHAETRRLFLERFGWEITASSFSSWMCDMGLKSPATASRFPWDAEKDAFFASIVPGRSEREIREAFRERYGVELTTGQIKNRRSKLGVKSGTCAGRFEKGQVPHNKGRTWDEQGVSPDAQARSRSTCFKKGQIPHNARGIPVGSERVSKDGYVEVKVSDHTSGKANDNWRFKHALVWEERNGPVPPSTMIVFADGDKSNFDPDNLVAVPRSAWAVIARNGIPYWDRESLEVAVLRAKVCSARYRREKKEKEK